MAESPYFKGVFVLSVGMVNDLFPRMVFVLLLSRLFGTYAAARFK